MFDFRFSRAAVSLMAPVVTAAHYRMSTFASVCAVDRCASLKPPQRGVVMCSAGGSGGDGADDVTTCRLVCPPGMALPRPVDRQPAVTDVFQCRRDVGVWTPTDLVPSCVGEYTCTHSLAVTPMACPGFFIGGKNEGSKAQSGCGVLGRGQQPPHHQLWGLEKHCELHQRGSGRSPDRPKVFHYFQRSGWPLLTLGLSCSH